MPVNDGRIANQNEFNDILSELSGLIRFHSTYKPILGGDFNIDLRRDVVVSDLLNQFITEESLINCSINDDLNNFTYISGTGSKSMLDYIFIDNNLVYSVGESKVICDGQNLSDHCPVSVSFEIDNDFLIEECQLKDSDNFVKHRWDRASVEQVQNYKLLLSELLSNINLDEDIINCKNVFCEDHKYEIFDFYHEIIDAINIAEDHCIPRVKPNCSKREMPGWNAFVKPIRERCIFWHGIWKNIGSPASGIVSDIRRLTRRKYHKAIQYIKYNKDSMIRYKIAKSVREASTCDFWKEIKKVNPQTSSYLPNTIDSAKGPNAIASLFKSKYGDLYNEYNEYDMSFCSRINESISNKCLNNNCSSGHHITSDIIKICIGKIKKNTLDPCFGIMSDSLKNAPEVLFDKLSIFFQLKFSHSITIDAFNQALIIPIPKDKRKSLSDSANYRAIALSSIFCKLFEYILIFL